MLTLVPDVLYASHSWLKVPENREQLEAWVNQYDLTLRDMQALTFTQAGIEVFLFVRDERGRIISDGKIPETKFVEMKYKRGTKPKIMKEGRVLKYTKTEGG